MALTFTMPLIWSLPEITWMSPWLGNLQIVIPIPANAIEALAAVLVSLAVTDSVVQVHPRLQGLPWRARVWGAWPLYSLPAAVCIVAMVAQPLQAPPLVSALALLAAIGCYVLTLFLLYDSMQRDHPHAGQFTFLLHGIAYLAAFLFFLLLYQTRGGVLLSVPLFAATALLLSIELLRDHTTEAQDLLRHASVIGLIMGKVALALSFAPFDELTKGTLLTWTFFLLVNICQNGMDGTLRPRLTFNYSVFSLLVLTVMFLIETDLGLLTFF